MSGNIIFKVFEYFVSMEYKVENKVNRMWEDMLLCYFEMSLLNNEINSTRRERRKNNDTTDFKFSFSTRNIKIEKFHELI